MSVLEAALAGDGAAVRFTGIDVPMALWNSLGRNIARGRQAVQGPGPSIVVPLDCFLQQRLWLGRALRTYDCAVVLDEALTSMLARGDREHAEVDALLSGDAGASDEGAALVDELVSLGFKRELKEFQIRDLAVLAGMSHGANFSVPGAGKTTVAYALHAIERSRGRVRRLLVVAPISAFGAWEEEAEECFTRPLSVRPIVGRGWRQADVLLVNYQRLAASYGDIARWALDEPTHVILDEAHRMKRGRGGQWGQACLELAHLAVRRDILTGTPAPQHPSDFVALIDFVWPHQASKIVPKAALSADPPPTAMAQVSSRLGPLFTRTTKAELHLADPVRKVELVTMKPLQFEIYEALRTKLRHEASARPRERAQWGQMGEVVMYLLEAASNPALLANAVAGTPGARLGWPSLGIPEGSSLAEKVLGYGAFEVPAKFEALATIVAANVRDGRKTLVWSNFRGTLSTLEDELLAPFNPVVVHGAVPSGAEDDLGTRESALRRFRHDRDCHVLLANPAAMSEGVSLHRECHDAVYVDRTFNAGQYLQSIDRIHRLGLVPGTETRIRFLVCRETVDETVDERVRVKAQRLAQMLSDPSLVTMALPDEEDYGEWVEHDDLDALLRHLGRG